MDKSSNNLTNHQFDISSQMRSERLGQNPILIWFTGISGSGKSTLSNSVEKEIFNKGFLTFSLDGDNVRNGICKDLSFTEKDRRENIRRIAEVASLMLDAGLIVFASFISPFESDRAIVKNLVGEKYYVEVYVNTPLEECERRDVKGLYSKARNGEIKNFTGISSPYEPPKSPDIIIDTSKVNLENASQLIINHILKIIK